MAIYSASVKPVSRAGGRSATAAAAYRNAVLIVDERTGEVHDYTRRRGVEFVESFAPAGMAPLPAAVLWNLAEAAETRRNARVAREVLVALPHELTAQQRSELAQDIAQALADRYGTAGTLAVHEPDSEGDNRNHHAHILMTTRRLEASGELGAKTRDLDSVGRGPLEVEWIRAMVEERTNRALERAGSAARVDRRTLEQQRAAVFEFGPPTREQLQRAAALDRLPTLHEGPRVTQIRRECEREDRAPLGQVVRLEINNDRRQLPADRAELAAVSAQIIDIEQASAKRAAEQQEEQEHDRRATPADRQTEPGIPAGAADPDAGPTGRAAGPRPEADQAGTGTAAAGPAASSADRCADAGWPDPAVAMWQLRAVEANRLLAERFAGGNPVHGDQTDHRADPLHRNGDRNPLPSPAWPSDRMAGAALHPVQAADDRVIAVAPPQADAGQELAERQQIEQAHADALAENRARAERQIEQLRDRVAKLDDQYSFYPPGYDEAVELEGQQRAAEQAAERWRAANPRISRLLDAMGIRPAAEGEADRVREMVRSSPAVQEAVAWREAERKRKKDLDKARKQLADALERLPPPIHAEAPPPEPGVHLAIGLAAIERWKSSRAEAEVEPEWFENVPEWVEWEDAGELYGQFEGEPQVYWRPDSQAEWLRVEDRPEPEPPQQRYRGPRMG